MDKLKLAHEYVKTILSMNNACHTMDDAVNIGWQYADLMYAEQEKRTDKTRPSVLEEFQVDWSKAPEWANWFAIDSDGKSNFFESKPALGDFEWFMSSHDIDYWFYDKIETNIGNWRNSLQERK